MSRKLFPPHIPALAHSKQSLLDEPNPNSPANSVAAQLYTENRREYEKMVHKCVEESLEDAGDDDDEDEEGAGEAVEMADGEASAAPAAAAAAAGASA